MARSCSTMLLILTLVFMFSLAQASRGMPWYATQYDSSKASNSFEEPNPSLQSSYELSSNYVSPQDNQVLLSHMFKGTNYQSNIQNQEPMQTFASNAMKQRYPIEQRMEEEDDMKKTMKVGSSQKVWCVGKPAVDEEYLRANLDFACGPDGGVDCSLIQPGGACYLPNTPVAHASYAMNLYYQKNGRNWWNCHFNNTGFVIFSDPSFGNCKYLAEWNFKN